jgi:hypothetical protein
LLDDSFKNHADRAWRIVKFETHANQKRSNTMRVQEGDVIKFGRVRFKVKKIVVDPADIRDKDLLKQSPNLRDSINLENEIIQGGILANETMLVSESQ